MFDFLKKILGEVYDGEVQEKIDEELGKLISPSEEPEEINREEELLKEIEQLKSTHSNEILKIKIDGKVDALLEKYGAKNYKAVSSLLDYDKISVDETGDVQGVSEQLDVLKQSDGFLFADSDLVGLKLAEKSDETQKSPSSMSYTELCEFFKKQ